MKLKKKSIKRSHLNTILAELEEMAKKMKKKKFSKKTTRDPKMTWGELEEVAK